MSSKKDREPKFKYMDEVIIEDDFFATIKGVVLAYQKRETGFWFWKKLTYLYMIGIEIRSGDGYVEERMIAVDEESIKPPVPELKRVK